MQHCSLYLSDSLFVLLMCIVLVFIDPLVQGRESRNEKLGALRDLSKNGDDMTAPRPLRIPPARMGVDVPWRCCV